MSEDTRLEIIAAIVKKRENWDIVYQTNAKHLDEGVSRVLLERRKKWCAKCEGTGKAVAFPPVCRACGGSGEKGQV